MYSLLQRLVGTGAPGEQGAGQQGPHGNPPNPPSDPSAPRRTAGVQDSRSPPKGSPTPSSLGLGVEAIGGWMTPRRGSADAPKELQLAPTPLVPPTKDPKVTNPPSSAPFLGAASRDPPQRTASSRTDAEPTPQNASPLPVPVTPAATTQAVNPFFGYAPQYTRPRSDTQSSAGSGKAGPPPVLQPVTAQARAVDSVSSFGIQNGTPRTPDLSSPGQLRTISSIDSTVPVIETVLTPQPSPSAPLPSSALSAAFAVASTPITIGGRALAANRDTSPSARGSGRDDSLLFDEQERQLAESPVDTKEAATTAPVVTKGDREVATTQPMPIPPSSQPRPPSQLSSRLASAGTSPARPRLAPLNVDPPPPSSPTTAVGPIRPSSATSSRSGMSSASLFRPSMRSQSPRRRKHRKKHTAAELQEIREKPYSNTSRIVHTAGSKGLGIAPLSSAAGKDKKNLVPVIVTWTGGGRAVFVTGSFNSWRGKVRMNRSHEDFTAILDLPPGTHHFKFVVDEEWRCSDDLPSAPDDAGNLVNYLVLDNEYGTNLGDGLDNMGDAEYTARDSDEDEYTVEGPDGELLSSSPEETYLSEIPKALLEPPSEPTPPPAPTGGKSPTRSKNSPDKAPVDPYSLAPPPLPPHLTKVVLNGTLTEEDMVTAGLPAPHNVALNHLYACSIRDGVMAVGITARYRSKFITTVMYKPVAVGEPAAGEADNKEKGKGTDPS